MDYTGDDSENVDNYNEIDSRCVVKFRPADGRDGWDGEYGFDWFREGDYGEKDQNQAYTMKSHYKKDGLIVGLGGVESSDKEANADSYAKQYYSPIPIRTPDNIITTIKGLFGVQSQPQSTYYVPSISLFYDDSKVESKKCKADIKLLIHAENVTMLEFLIDEGIQGIEVKPLAIVGNINGDSDDKSLTISLGKDFSNNAGDVIIKVLATRVNTSVFGNTIVEKKTAGLIKVVKYKPKQVDIVIIPIPSRLDDSNGQVKLPDQNKIDNVIKSIKHFFSQAQIIPSCFIREIKKSQVMGKIEQIINAAKHTYYDSNNFPYDEAVGTTTERNIAFNDGEIVNSGTQLHEALEKKFNDEELESTEFDVKLKNAYKVFYIFNKGFSTDRYGTDWLLNGEASGFPGISAPPKNVIVFDNPLPFESASHELFHRLGLRHIFELPQNQYTFEKYKTSNIMDYERSYRRISLWRWQWDIIRDQEGIIDIESQNQYNLA